MLQWRKWLPCWMSVMVHLTISSMMCCNSTKWMPKQVTSELKERHMDACEEFLWWYEAEGDGFLKCKMTVNKSWVHYYHPGMKRSSKGWCHSSWTKPKKFPRKSDADAIARGSQLSVPYCIPLRNQLRSATRSKYLTAQYWCVIAAWKR